MPATILKKQPIAVYLLWFLLTFLKHLYRTVSGLWLPWKVILSCHGNIHDLAHWYLHLIIVKMLMNRYLIQIFYSGRPYLIETSPLIFSANQWTDSHIVRTSVMKELKVKISPKISLTTETSQIFCNSAISLIIFD